ncbi:hypothetical protein COL516b_009438 [Colletotrichum fioriniae]|nr:uncharacterized protein COL516b_009438 [Colletotrichum fioriniae]KAJ0299185.1 hypothetical protein COL516b_009438 [Colletotrichum fioriniae]
MASSSQKIRVIRLASVLYHQVDVEKAAQFLEDFGLREVARQGERIYFAGFGVDPYVYALEKSPGSRRAFIGATWVVENENDLEVAANHPGATGIQDEEGPGGGKRVDIIDPNGYYVGFIHGQAPRSDIENVDKSRIADKERPLTNLVDEKPRKGRFKRFNYGPSPVHKLGHYGFMVPKETYEKTLKWYTGLMNLVPNDVVFDPQTNKDTTCFMHIDRNSTFTDHHTPFVHHASFEVNDMDTQALGHEWLLKKGYTNCWGIGRHVLGSQLFDYW